MGIEAVSHRIIVKPDPVEKTTKSGIILEIDEKLHLNASTLGTIVSIGEDAWIAYKPKREFAGLKVGDRVYFAKYAGQWQQDEETGEKFLCLNDGDITSKSVKKTGKGKNDKPKNRASVVAS